MVITLQTHAGPKCQVGDFSLLVNPPSNKKGSLILKTKNEIPIDSFTGTEVIGGPGEYEIDGVRIRGIELTKESAVKEISTAFTVELDGIAIAFIIDISDELTKDELDALRSVDILFLGIDTKKITEKHIKSLIKKVDAKIIIPTDDKTAEYLADALGQKVSSEEKLVIKKSDLSKGDMVSKLVWLKTK